VHFYPSWQLNRCEQKEDQEFKVSQVPEELRPRETRRVCAAMLAMRNWEHLRRINASGNVNDNSKLGKYLRIRLLVKGVVGTSWVLVGESLYIRVLQY